MKADLLRVLYKPLFSRKLFSPNLRTCDVLRLGGDKLLDCINISNLKTYHLKNLKL